MNTNDYSNINYSAANYLSSNYLVQDIAFNFVSIHRLKWPYDTSCITCNPYHTCTDYVGVRMREKCIKSFQKIHTLILLYDDKNYHDTKYYDSKKHDTRYEDMIHSYPIITSKHFRNYSFRNEFT